VGNCNITAAKSDIQFQNDPMPLDEVNRILWWENISLDGLNHRVT